MKCPFCQNDNDKVIDSRSANEGAIIRRRRECLMCHRRFTTYEKIEEIPLMVVKKDKMRESYDRNKAIAGLLKACEKRPVPLEVLERCVDELEKLLEKRFAKEVASSEIGEFFMKRLYDIDEVAYVRFASVYRQFKDISHFMQELKTLLSKP
jgi:transcriptional repressor NrdR